ncbi:MAG: prephenate dehydrogenase/arogenate dehydrogenase family protein, partial [Prosthecobacter sp.]|nr:prephenate dehydrogenase/arogenate dehydrogenase family protein [Prosthecobacter sp.]
QEVFRFVKSITIYGPGLLGGSLALAIQERLPQVDLCLWARCESAFEDIRAKGIKGRMTTDALAAAEGASLIILATPVTAMPDLARQMAPAVAADAIITDVGSVKASVVKALEPIFGKRFIGSHPMAGSEKAGIETARGDLFQGAVCLLTPTARTAPASVTQLSQFWQALGCRVLEFTPEDHDLKVARISHLPHLMACVTTLAALRGDPAAAACVANGFRDTTRVAGGDPDMWTGIAMENRAALLACAREASATLTELLEILEKPDEEALRRFLTEAKTRRDQVQAGAF